MSIMDREKLNRPKNENELRGIEKCVDEGSDF